MSYTTRKSLLMRIQSGDQIAWSQFYDTYRPFICKIGCNLRLPPDECDDLVQQVMREIFQKSIIGGNYNPEAIPDDVGFVYDPAKGRFRHYLAGIVRNQGRKMMNKNLRNDKFNQPLDCTPDSAVTDEEHSFDQMLEHEFRVHNFYMANDELRNRVEPQTYNAYEMTVIRGRSPRDVAKFLGISENSVYVYKHRCLTIIRDIIKQYEDK